MKHKEKHGVEMQCVILYKNRRLKKSCWRGGRGLNRFQTYFTSKLIFTVLSQLKTLVYKLDPTH